jgi:RNA polymerase sigma-70 factor (ECF subfamily)
MADGLESELRDAWEAARAAWTGIDVPAETFAAHLAARCTPETGLASLDTVDLYVACGCVHDVPGARELFARTFLPRIDQFVRHLDPTPGFADEVRQQVAEKLLLGTATSSAKLADYAGRGPLGAWVRVAALRVALNMVAQRSPDRVQALDDVIADLPANEDPELDYLRARYLPAFRDAIRAALASLSSQQRNVLRLHLVSGISTEKIGTLYHVNQSTAARWLQSARAAIRAGAEARLTTALGVSHGELAALTRLILSRLDVSITSLLRE